MRVFEQTSVLVFNIFKTLIKILGIELIIGSIIFPVAIVTACMSNDSIDCSCTTDLVHHDTEVLDCTNEYNSVYLWQVYGGDFGEDQLAFLQEQCSKYNIPMEIMLSIICTESGFRSNAQSKISSASGYCQVIKGSAKWVYEDLLKYGTYDIENHSTIMTTNWKLNIEIGCRIIYCWYWNCDESWELAIRRYHGGSVDDMDTYLNTVNRHMFELFGLTVTDLM